MSDHAEDVQEPVEPVEESSTSEQLGQDAPQGDAPPSDSSTENGKPESGAEKRIRELTWHRREAERRAQEAEQRLRELESRSKQPEQPQGDLRVPIESDYDDPEQYRKDLDAYTREVYRREAEAVQRQARERETEAQREQRIADLRDRVGKYAAENPDFVEATQNASMAPLPHLIDYMADSDKAPELLHYLAKNPDHASRIEALSPVAAARELARVEYELEQTQAKRLSDAPPPMGDVDDGPTATPTEVTDKQSVSEFLAARGGYRIR